MAAENEEKYWEPVVKFYNQGVAPREFKVGDLVQKLTTALMRNSAQPMLPVIGQQEWATDS